MKGLPFSLCYGRDGVCQLVYKWRKSALVVLRLGPCSNKQIKHSEYQHVHPSSPGPLSMLLGSWTAGLARSASFLLKCSLAVVV